MATFRTDPLLAIARLALTFSMGITILVGGATTLAAPLMWLARDKVYAEIAKDAIDAPHWQFIIAVSGILLLIAAMAALAFLFLRAMRRMVDSVGEGDPFVPVNADRLRHMGWLTLAIQALGVPAGALALWIGKITEGNDTDFGVSLSGILLAIVLFILARVFRKGAEMREELEGTV